MFTRLKRILPASIKASRTTIQTAAQNYPVEHPNPSAESLSHRNLGDKYLDEGKLDDAAQSYHLALSLSPDNSEALCGLGMIYLQQALYADAEYYLRQAVASNSELAQAHYFLGSSLQHQGKLNEAVECFHQARELKPDAEIIYSDLCYALFQLGQNEAAKAVIEQGISVNPNFADFHFFLGNLYGHEKAFDQAIACYQKTLAIQPDNTLAHLNLGKIFHDQGKTDAAISCYRNVLAINPYLDDALYNLGLVLQIQKRDEALDCYRKVLMLTPEHYAAKMHLLRQMQKQCEWIHLEQDISQLRKVVHEFPATSKNLLDPFSFLSLPDTTAEEQQCCAQRYAQFEYLHLSSLRNKLGFEFNRPATGKIHIGYLSGDLRQHPVSFLMAEIFELHDRNRFHVTAYSYGQNDGSAMRVRLKKAFDNFVDIQNDSYEKAARKIYADHIDILIDITGYTKDTRSGILALRPAPIQVNYLGYPGTMGTDFVDYLLADRFIIPPEEQNHYTEKIIWLPDCFMPNDSTRPRPKTPTRRECGLPETGFVFCCFNQAYKITPELFNIWCQLLRAVPDSVLWLAAASPQVEINLQREAHNRGVDSGRIVMAGRLPEMEAHLARLQCADLFLDTLPFNAHSTCNDALWMGLPVVTCTGGTFPSRVAGSLLSAIGTPELITYNLNDYYHLALDLATHREKLAAIRSKIIANRDTAPLFDSERFTRNLEQAYIEMLEAYSAPSIHTGNSHF